MDIDLQDIANAASIVTAVVAVWAYAHYRLHWWRKRERLEQYLRKARLTATGVDRGQRSVAHLASQLGMSEADILHVAFDSKRIAAQPGADPVTGRPDALLLVYDATATSA
jgi:hypothetical protein